MGKLIGRGWPRAQQIIERGDLFQIMQTHLKIVKVKEPDYTVGELYAVGNICQVCDALMDHLEHRLEVIENIKEGENGKEKS